MVTMLVGCASLTYQAIDKRFKFYFVKKNVLLIKLLGMKLLLRSFFYYLA